MNKIKLLVAPNSFKECANAVDVAAIINRQFDEPEFDLKCLPISDGGDGFLSVCEKNFRLKLIEIDAASFYDDTTLNVPIGIAENGTQLYCESADVIGMKKIPAEKRNPLNLNSEYLGSLFIKLENEFPTISKMILGLGGTATSDLGLGLCVPFGLKLFDKEMEPLPVLPKYFSDAASIKLPERKLAFSIEVIADVNVPLFGKTGTSKTFAKQKGASENEIEILETGVNQIISILKNEHALDFSSQMFGAGGGLLLGLSLISTPQIHFADEFLINNLNLENEVKDSDFIITGEGAFDAQSMMNKGTGIVIHLAQKFEKTVFVICGKDSYNSMHQNQSQIKAFSFQKYFTSQQSAISNYKMGIETACKEIKSYILSHT